jgi:chitin synthase
MTDVNVVLLNRVKALRDVIPTYASHVEKGLEFLTKDMGEDRWLCTLMVRINST